MSKQSELDVNYNNWRAHRTLQPSLSDDAAYTIYASEIKRINEKYMNENIIEASDSRKEIRVISIDFASRIYSSNTTFLNSADDIINVAKKFEKYILGEQL